MNSVDNSASFCKAADYQQDHRDKHQRHATAAVHVAATATPGRSSVVVSDKGEVESRRERVAWVQRVVVMMRHISTVPSSGATRVAY